MASDESIKSIPDIFTQYSLALADLNNDSSVSLYKIAWIYDLSWSILQACWKERQSAKTFQTDQQWLSVHKKNALIQWINTMTAWGWPSQIEQLWQIEQFYSELIRSCLTSRSNSRRSSHKRMLKMLKSLLLTRIELWCRRQRRRWRNWLIKQLDIMH